MDARLGAQRDCAGKLSRKFTPSFATREIFESAKNEGPPVGLYESKRESSTITKRTFLPVTAADDCVVKFTIGEFDDACPLQMDFTFTWYDVDGAKPVNE